MTKLWLCCLALILLAACGNPGPVVCSGDCMVYRSEPFTYRADDPDERFF